MKKQQWLKIIPFFLCIFTLMALFLRFGYARFDHILADGKTEQFFKEYSGWQAVITTLYGWVLVALPIVILLTKLVPELKKLEPMASLVLPGLHVVLMFLLLNSLPNAVRDIPGLENARSSVGIGFILMLVLQVALIVLRMMEFVTKPAAPEPKPNDPGLVPVQEEQHPSRR